MIPVRGDDMTNRAWSRCSAEYRFGCYQRYTVEVTRGTTTSWFTARHRGLEAGALPPAPWGDVIYADGDGGSAGNAEIRHAMTVLSGCANNTVIILNWSAIAASTAIM